MSHADNVHNTMYSLLSYVRVFEEYYGVRFIDVCIMDIEEDMLYSNFLAGNLRATYIRYISVNKMMIKD